MIRGNAGLTTRNYDTLPEACGAWQRSVIDALSTCCMNVIDVHVLVESLVLFLLFEFRDGRVCAFVTAAAIDEAIAAPASLIHHKTTIEAHLVLGPAPPLTM